MYAFFNYFSISLTSFLVVLILTNYVKKIAFDIKAVDIPRTRHVHTKITPKLGGLGIFFGFLMGYILYNNPTDQMNAVLIGSFIIIITGIVDDITELQPKHKFIGQLLSALIVVFYGNFYIRTISIFGFGIDLGVFSQIFTIIFILGCINCINLIDGLDGLASGISIIYFATIAIIAFLKFKFDLELMLSIIMLFSTLGFLFHNFNPATIFLGDSGSMFLGYMISIIAILGFKNVTFTSLFAPIMILAIPIFDTIFAIIRRILKGESPAKADKFHIHHQILNMNFTHKQTVLIIYFVNSLFAIASIFLSIDKTKISLTIYLLLFVLTLIFVLKTTVIADFKERGKNNL